VLGRRLRYLNTAAGPSPENGPVFEIVGVVSDLPDNLDARILYHPLSADSSDEATLSVRLAGAKDGAAPRLWASAEPFSAALRLSDLRTLEDVYTENERDDNLSAYALAAATTSVLLLSAAGIHALMSFTIHRKRREIGIRSALGARPQRLLLDVSRQALVQVGLGALLGGSVAMALAYWIPVDELGGRSVPGLIPAAALLLMGVGLLAAIGPARRALRVEPTEALREG
jgi:predicted lysophospholipase L1 biosynthesis ABC-type transport system permease subunit